MLILKEDELSKFMSISSSSTKNEFAISAKSRMSLQDLEEKDKTNIDDILKFHYKADIENKDKLFETHIKNGVFPYIENLNENLFMYNTYIVKEVVSAIKYAISIGYDGDKFYIIDNEEFKLDNEKIIKKESGIPLYLEDIYKERNELPKQVGYLLKQKFTGYNSVFERIKNNFNLFQNVQVEKKRTLEESNNITKDKETTPLEEISTAKALEKVESKPIQKKKDKIAQESPQKVIPQVQTNIIETSLDKDYLKQLESFKRKYAIEELETKEKNNSFSFRNIEYPTPTNELEEAIAFNGGDKPILVYGVHGSGKSFTAEQYAKSIEKYAKVPISFYSLLLEKNLDKSDIVGHALLENNGFNYQMMSKAFMSARDGNLTVFLADEFLRLKELGVFFNLFGEDYYKLETGRQLEVVEMIVHDIDGNLHTTHFQLTDRRKFNPEVILENGKITILKNEKDNVFKKLPQQKIEEELAHGKLPLIDKRDYENFMLDILSINSFYTAEVIKAPVEKLIIILAGNMGTDYIKHISIDSDKAFLSRCHICEMLPPDLQKYMKKFENILKKRKEEGILKWTMPEHEIDGTIKNLKREITDIFKALIKSSSQNTTGNFLNISYRTFEEIATVLSRTKEITPENIKKTLEKQIKSILPHVEDSDGRKVLASAKTEYIKTINVALGLPNSHETTPTVTSTPSSASRMASVAGSSPTTTSINEEDEEVSAGITHGR